ncbi:MAG TPA: hypothetical protein VLT62_06800 [Candidatus Methylomirabilis sp.]|nr:hypothetical protein [Candidatus Methylomirabilis sp.]
MPDSANPDFSATSSLIRWSLRLLAGVALGIGGALVVFPDRTDRYFAWTIKAPIAAATLGAWFLVLAAFALSLSRRSREAAQPALLTIAAGAALMLLTTIIHRAAFNWGSPVAWIWLAIYLLGPPLFFALFVGLGLPSARQKAATAHASTARTLLACIALLYGAVAAILFVWPSLLIPVWPWPLLALGARTYSTFLLGHALWMWWVSRSDRGDLREMPLPYLGIFPLVALAAPFLHPNAFRATSPGGLAFLLVLGLTVVVTPWLVRRLRDPASDS